MKKPAALLCTLIPTLVLAGAVHAHAVTREECSEGSDFIKNAALSREMGMGASTFIAKMREDFELIKSYPAELRWFVQDEDDEQQLLSAVTDVFESPREPEVHQREFFSRCLAHARVTTSPGIDGAGKHRRAALTLPLSTQARIARTIA
jgi:hypothetical protein